MFNISKAITNGISKQSVTQLKRKKYISSNKFNNTQIR